ncbi:MAG: ATP-binding protein [Gammaproteobacteria bacterium]|nr:ATP-binding protein [Gammaproteobacteria bacterium]
MAAEYEPGLVVCVTGPESSGKTTLASELARALAVPLVTEVAREYLAGKSSYDADDLLAIARAQLSAEQNALAEGTGVVVCDTDLQVIQIWWQEKFGELDPWLEEALSERTQRCYLLAAPDLPWQPDPLRESAEDRERLFDRYARLLRDESFSFAEVRGTGGIRFERALKTVQGWLAEPMP